MEASSLYKDKGTREYHRFKGESWGQREEKKEGGKKL